MRCTNFIVCRANAEGGNRCVGCTVNLDKTIVVEKIQSVGAEQRCLVCLEDQPIGSTICRLWTCRHHICIKCTRDIYRMPRIHHSHAGLSRRLVNRFTRWMESMHSIALRSSAVRVLVDTMVDFDYFDVWFARDFIDNHATQLPKQFRRDGVELLRWWTGRVIKSTQENQRRVVAMASMEQCCLCKID